jgi:hypothetical protein
LGCVHIKEKVFLYLIKHHVMKAYGGVKVQLHAILTTIRKMEVNFTPLPLCSREAPFGTYWIGGWVGTIAGVDAARKRKIYFLCRESDPSSSVTQPKRSHYTDRAVPILSND